MCNFHPGISPLSLEGDMSLTMTLPGGRAAQVAALLQSNQLYQHAELHGPPDPGHEHHPALYEGSYLLITTLLTKNFIYKKRCLPSSRFYTTFTHYNGHTTTIFQGIDYFLSLFFKDSDFL